MGNPSAGWLLIGFCLVTLVLTAATFYTSPISAVKKTTTTHGTKTTTKSTTSPSSATPHHIKGVKLSHVHTVPSKVAVGTTFGLRGIVLNNSTATITFANGTCASPLSITFNKNVMSEPRTTTATCKAQQVTLKPGEQSAILSPDMSGKAYRATAPGTTNASMTFKYGVVTTTSKTPISDSISRFFAFTILPGTQQAAATSTTSASTTNTLSQPGPLKLLIP